MKVILSILFQNIPEAYYKYVPRDEVKEFKKKIKAEENRLKKECRLRPTDEVV